MGIFSNITGFFSQLRSDPAGTLITFVYMAVCILLSLILHEVAHGAMALRCGDATAKWLGRLTLDPRKHLDPLGTLCMVFLRVGWAKPVPINPRNFRNYRRDYILVSLAGIMVNLALFLLSMLISALLAKAIWQPDLISYAAKTKRKSMFLDIYHYNPANAVYGGDYAAWADYSSSTVLMYVQRLFLMLAQMNLGLAIFNLIPVPPLDGYRFVDEFVFRGRLAMNPQTMQIIHTVFLVVCISGLLSGFLTTVNGAVFGAVSNLFALLI